MSDLTSKACSPCEGGTVPLSPNKAIKLLGELSGWAIVENHHLLKHYKFSNFSDGLAFVNCIGAIAEQEGHHPDIKLSWGKVTVEVWTHAVDGLSENDFILAAKIDAQKH